MFCANRYTITHYSNLVLVTYSGSVSWLITNFQYHHEEVFDWYRWASLFSGEYSPLDIRYMLLLCLSADSIFSPLYNLFLFVIPYCPLGCGYESVPVCSRYNLQYLESDFPLRTDTCDRQSIYVLLWPGMIRYLWSFRTRLCQLSYIIVTLWYINLIPLIFTRWRAV